MKKILHFLLPILLLSSQALQGEQCCDCLEAAMEEMNDLYRTGEGCDDGIFNCVSASMIGWGLGLFAGIALLTGLVHNSHSESTKTSSSNGSNN